MLLLEFLKHPIFLGDNMTSEDVGTGSSNEDSKRPLAEVRGLGGGAGAA